MHPLLSSRPSSCPCKQGPPNVFSSLAPFGRCLWQRQLLGKLRTGHLIPDGLAEAPGGVQQDMTEPMPRLWEQWPLPHRGHV